MLLCTVHLFILLCNMIVMHCDSQRRNSDNMMIELCQLKLEQGMCVINTKMPIKAE